MRRIAKLLALAALAAIAIVVAGASDEQAGKSYKLMFDNAFGLVEGGDFRVGGVRAGSTPMVELEAAQGRRPLARVTAEVTEPGFDDFRKDASCEIKPQSLIGEYYVDCQAGSSAERLPDGATIDVEHTRSTIPQDLVNNIFRTPYRERLRLILTSLGAALAGRPEDIQAVLKRAHPGLRETTEVLRVLGRENKALEAFITDAERVVSELEDNTTEVVRFVQEAGETAEISASRRQDIERSLERLPTFLAELDPTMARLGALADEQVPLLSDLRRAAPDLTELFTRLGPFAEAARPALSSLGQASETGVRAFRRGSEEINELRVLAREAPAFAKPLRQFLESLDDRRRAIDNDPRATVNGPPASDPSYAGGRGGFTGLEAFWNYPFWQTLSINPFDTFGHVLRAGLTLNKCSPYSNDAKDDPQLVEDCNQWLGPYQPGINAPDPTDPAAASAVRLRAEAGKPAHTVGERRSPGQPEAGPLPGQPDISKPQITLPPPVQQLLDRLPRLDELLPGAPELDDTLPLEDLLGGDSRTPEDGLPVQLLDHLLGP